MDERNTRKESGRSKRVASRLDRGHSLKQEGKHQQQLHDKQSGELKQHQFGAATQRYCMHDMHNQHTDLLDVDGVRR